MRHAMDGGSMLNIMDNGKKKTLSALCGRAHPITTAPSTTPSPLQIKTGDALLRSIFNASTLAIVVVDRECRIAAINTAAQNTIEYSSQIRISAEGKLRLLDAKIHSALLDQLSKVTSGLTVRFPLFLGESLCKTEPFARVNPLQTTAEGAKETLAMICFSSAKPAHYDHQLAWSLYKLSRAELAVCEELVSGNSVKQISSSRGTSTETVRYQLKSIFAKTQTNSQHSLVSLLLRTTALPSFR